MIIYDIVIIKSKTHFTIFRSCEHRNDAFGNRFDLYVLNSFFYITFVSKLGGVI